MCQPNAGTWDSDFALGSITYQHRNLCLTNCSYIGVNAWSTWPLKANPWPLTPFCPHLACLYLPLSTHMSLLEEQEMILSSVFLCETSFCSFCWNYPLISFFFSIIVIFTKTVPMFYSVLLLKVFVKYSLLCK